ncbi:hypothetical protein [Allokutzneria sp. NRRL B-24872]|uniref:hypothetical protein n=1 Tax=Allokutzneria sp. NRRL B-24872 TaxID=1137961 RepID=UPI00143DD761|nr:hypothetical protein [Allokutzneria sp. NRRL B-24872]
MSELGALLGMHRVANRRILVVGGIALAIGIGAAVFTANLVLGGPSRWAGNSSSIDRTIGIGMGVVVVGVLGGTWLLVKALRGGLNEVFEVHEHGLVHNGRSWRWEQVVSIDSGHPPQQNGATRLLGTGHRCVVRFDDGQRIRFDGLTLESDRLESLVRHHCPTAGPQPHHEQRWRRFGAGWLVVGLLLLGSVVAMFVNLAVNDPDYGDGALALISVGAIVVITAGFACIATFFTVRRKQ